MFPAVFRPMLRAAKKCGVRAVRNPFEPLLFASARQWKRRFQLSILCSFRRAFRRALDEAGMLTPDGCIGMVATGGLSLETFQALIKSLPDGTWEFVSHPGYNDPELDTVKTRLRSSRENELQILTSPEVKDLLRREQIELISYREFGSTTHTEANTKAKVVPLSGVSR
jgi:predicted glycoside hydrolase/deacetylase ChbG (UPF0249 family)